MAVASCVKRCWWGAVIVVRRLCVWCAVVEPSEAWWCGGGGGDGGGGGGGGGVVVVVVVVLTAATSKSSDHMHIIKAQIANQSAIYPLVCVQSLPCPPGFFLHFQSPSLSMTVLRRLCMRNLASHCAPLSSTSFFRQKPSSPQQTLSTIIPQFDVPAQITVQISIASPPRRATHPPHLPLSLCPLSLSLLAFPSALSCIFKPSTFALLVASAPHPLHPLYILRILYILCIICIVCFNIYPLFSLIGRRPSPMLAPPDSWGDLSCFSAPSSIYRFLLQHVRAQTPQQVMSPGLGSCPSCATPPLSGRPLFGGFYPAASSPLPPRPLS